MPRGWVGLPENTFAGFDIIGDIHGCANALVKLLTLMGYRNQDGVFRHPDRLAVFLGDVLDRGPHIREALGIVKNMVDQGAALCVMGNHEYNALGYTTPLECNHNGSVEYVRPHTARHNRLIAETLEQFAGYPEEWRAYLKWFETLPLFLELPGFRVVHACWDQGLIDQFKSLYNGNCVDAEFIKASADKHSFAGRFMDRLTRGIDLPLPDGMTMVSRDGYIRNSFRTKFWAARPISYRDVVFQPDPLPPSIADRLLTADEQATLIRYDDREPPVFVGHYWLQGRPRPIRDNVICLDYSAVKYGRLVAYRYDGESQVSEDKFVWVYVDPDM